MASIRSRNAAVTFKHEVTAGTEVAPDALTDAILVEAPAISFNPNIIKTNEVTGSLDGMGSIVGGMTAQIKFTAYLKGSGVAGTAPEIGQLLQACAWSEVVTATAIPASAEACAAGGSTTMAVLGTSASTTAQLYRGMPIVFTGTVAGTSFIHDYSAAKAAKLTDTLSGSIVATTNYQIPVNVLYKPASTDIPSGTLYVYMDGLLYKFVGVRGNPDSITWTSGGAAKISFTLYAMFVSKTDVAVPATSYDSTRPPVWRDGSFTINAAAASGSELTVSVGNTLSHPDNPNAAEGYDPAEVMSRAMTGSMKPYETLVATRNVIDDFRSQTTRPLHASMGNTAGNRVAMTIPAALYTNQTPQDKNGASQLQVPFDCVGQDAGAFICFW